MKNLKFNMKKLVALVLAGTIALSVSGCGKKKSEPLVFSSKIQTVQDDTCFDEHVESIPFQKENEDFSLMDSLEMLEEHINILEVLPNDIELDENLRSEIELPTIEYEVNTGDSLSLIADKYGVSVDSIMKLNNLTTTTIWPGQILKIDTLILNEVTLENAQALLEKYSNFDDLSRDEKIKLLNNIVNMRTSANQWIVSHVRNILERASLSAIKCKILDAYGFDETSIDQVRIKNQSSKDGYNSGDVEFSDVSVDKKGKSIDYNIVLSGQWDGLLDTLYNIQSTNSDFDFEGQSELSTEDIELIKNTLNAIANVISREAETKKSIWGNQVVTLIK